MKNTDTHTTYSVTKRVISDLSIGISNIVVGIGRIVDTKAIPIVFLCFCLVMLIYSSINDKEELDERMLYNLKAGQFVAFIVSFFSAVFTSFFQIQNDRTRIGITFLFLGLIWVLPAVWVLICEKRCFRRQEFTTIISDIREEKGMSISELAELVEVAPTTMFRIENGLYTPSLELANEIAEALGASSQELFHFTS